MRLSQFYAQAIKFGRDCDPRGKQFLQKRFKNSNPYPDSQILHGEINREVKNLLIGIDIEVPEILLADRLRQKQGLDLVIAHHPEGKALFGLSEVMRLQVKLLKQVGIKEEIAKDLVAQRQFEVERRFLPSNYMRAVDAARILNLPFLCLHTVADNQVAHFLQGLFRKKNPRRLQEIMQILEEIPEYRLAKKEGAGPRIVLGKPQSPVGKILIEMTGGTEGSKEVFPRLYEEGVRTLVCMHASEEHFRKIKETNLNVIIAGHISSDSLGLNLLLDRISKDTRLNITECSGFRRIRRS